VQSDTHNSLKTIDSFLNALPDVLLAFCTSNVHRDVVDFRHSHPDVLSLYSPVLIYGCHNGTPLSIFPEA